jgi:hypothetical protein
VSLVWQVIKTTGTQLLVKGIHLFLSNLKVNLSRRRQQCFPFRKKSLTAVFIMNEWQLKEQLIVSWPKTA